MSEVIKTDKAPEPKGAYVQARKAGNFIFVSGQGPLDPKTNKIIEGDIKVQTKRTLENIKAILEAAGADLSHVVKIGAFLKDLSDFSQFNEVYAEFFAGDYPARTTVGADLPVIKVEIDAIAFVP